MSNEVKELKKSLAKLKRIASETAGEIHDIVEDTLWSEFDRLPELSEALVSQCKEAKAFQKENGL
ncbi:CCE_0567 family metalloprotein [Magnetococcus sp. PR-3]|uniref:CCE_0567 family metalloprotein n=1 Tax=Magnetococcus sp. PR-3 TaxID=3120355 RepID=UPI002FCDF3AD